MFLKGAFRFCNVRWGLGEVLAKGSGFYSRRVYGDLREFRVRVLIRFWVSCARLCGGFKVSQVFRV